MENVCGWIAQAGHSPVRDRLSGTQKADWLIIGAGITGLCAAHSLAAMHPQARIVIVDRQRAAQGASARNSGFVVAHEHPTPMSLQAIKVSPVMKSIPRFHAPPVRKSASALPVTLSSATSGMPAISSR